MTTSEHFYIKKKIKESIVAIGVYDKKNDNDIILGSGFCITENGIALTTRHVLGDYFRLLNESFVNGNEFEISMFQNLFNGQQLLKERITVKRIQNLIFKKKVETEPSDLDVSLLYSDKEIKGRQYLEIKTIDQNLLYKKICICGFPMGNSSFSMNKNEGIRFNPIIQFGRLSGFMPFDEFPTP